MASDIPPDANLRERLARAFNEPFGDLGASNTAALVVAAWLRDKAATSEKYAARDLTGMEFAAAWRLNALADEIDPPKGDET